MQTFTKLSIITICFNNLEEVRATCASVDKQIIPPFEHLIINGSTNDEIRKYFEQTNQVLYRKVINESDEGIADAFNKGIVRSSGDVILLLNSGDLLYDDKVVEIVLSKFKIAVICPCTIISL